MIALVLEASAYSASVGLVRDGVLLAEDVVAMKGADEERLLPAVLAVLGGAGLGLADLSRVICGAGPGSFTSLRIAAAIAKGIAFGRGIPLHPVSSIALAAAAAAPPPGRYFVASDALRGEWYAAPVNVDERATVQQERAATTSTPAEVLAEARASGSGLIAVGISGAASHVPPGVRVIESHPRASGILRVRDWESIPEADLAAWEPLYGRVAEAQARWEAAHGRALSDG